MTATTASTPDKRIELASLVLAAVGLLVILEAHLVPALFAGMLVHVLVHLLAPRLFGFKDQPARARVVVVILLTLLILGITALMIGAAVVFFRSGHASLAVLMQRMAEIIDSSRDNMPVWLQDSMPADAGELKDVVVTWLRVHASELGVMGGGIGRGIVYSLIGMVVGALVALRETHKAIRSGPLARALSQRASLLTDAFRRVVLAQIRIAGLNAVLAGIYLLIALPLLDIHIPFTKTMTVLTFIVGLLPIIGNLISNTVIVIISMSHSLQLAITSLVFLVVIHKLEYFVNARIVGSQINASAWELLVAMLVMEALFGLQGVVAAPVFYCYVKSELKARSLI